MCIYTYNILIACMYAYITNHIYISTCIYMHIRSYTHSHMVLYQQLSSKDAQPNMVVRYFIGVLV